MRRVFLDGKFFAEWAGSLQDLAIFSKVEVSRLGYDLDTAKADRKAELNFEFGTAMAALHEGWPDYEIQTWTVQAEEARQWITAKPDAKPLVPFLSSLHAQREAMGWEGTLEELVERVIQNTNAYTAATASLIGQRHVAERAIDAADDPSSITWEFSLPTPTDS